MKQRMQGMVIGVLATVLLLGTVTAFASTTRTIEVTFGNIRTTIFGQEFVTHNSYGVVIEPFYYNGDVYMPIDAILHAMGDNAQWDEATKTFNFGVAEGEQAPQVEVRHYLGSDIFSVESRWWVEHPANGSFVMAGVTYHSGVTIEQTRTAPASRRLGETMTGALYGRATYDISELGVTKLTGTLGSVNNVTGGTLTVTCADSGRFLGGGDVAGGRNATSTDITIEIPSNVQRVTIQLQTPSAWRGPGFGNAFFS